MKQTSHHIAAVIVNWNGKNDTLACLASLQKINVLNNMLSVIVVDNGSTDDSVSAVRGAYPDVVVVETGDNLGFTGGNNAGIKKALALGADLVWLLNNDTIVDRNVLSFVKAFEDPKVGACGSKIYFAAGHEFHHDRYGESERGKIFWYAGGLVDWDNVYASHRGVDEVDHGQYEETMETPFITGCSFIVRADVIQNVGTLDDRYYLYLEDLDWSLRIQKAGWKTMYVPSSLVWHVNAGSSGRPGNPLQNYYLTRNRFLLGMKYAPLRSKAALLREAVRFLISGSMVQKKAVLDFFTGRMGRRYEPKIHS